MPEDNTGYFFADALAESGVKVVSQGESESAEKQEPQTSFNKSITNDESFVDTKKKPSETQGSVENKDDSSTDKPTNESSSLEGGESEDKSSIIDLNASTEVNETSDKSTNESQFNVSEMFGEDFKSVDDVIEQLNYAHELQAKVVELESRKPTYANEFVEKLDEYVRNGGDPVYFAKVQSINVDSLAPIDALKLDLQWQHNLTDEEAQAFIESTYQLNEYGEGEINPKAVQLKIDSTNAKKNLKERQADNTLIEPKSNGISEEEWKSKQKEAEAARENENNIRMWDEKKGWAPEVDKAIESMKTNGIVLDIGNGKGFKFAYEKDEKYTEELILKVDQALYDSGLSREENPQLAKDIANNLFFLENRAEIMNAYANKIRGMKDEEFFKTRNNPSALNRGDKPVTQTETPKSAEDQMSNIWGG